MNSKATLFHSTTISNNYKASPWGQQADSQPKKGRIIIVIEDGKVVTFAQKFPSNDWEGLYGDGI